MLLSDAILKGCKDTYQNTTFYFIIKSNDDDTICGTCVMGAAYKGLIGMIRYNPEKHYVRNYLEKTYPYLRDYDFWDKMIAMNDVFGYTREDIAAWLKEQGL